MGVKTLVLDEANHLLDMGFRKDIEKIIAAVPKQRQTLMFSATIPDEHNSKVEPVTENGNTYPETKTISSENGDPVGTNKDVVVEGFGSVGVYDQWIAPPVSGQRAKARYEHGAGICGAWSKHKCIPLMFMPIPVEKLKDLCLKQRRNQVTEL